MRLVYQYRLRPTNQQIATFENWLELCRRQCAALLLLHTKSTVK
ncbi:MAG: helix-turn-helix domain-containing protein [Gloeotrichia echinulata DVL01]|nr:helix-turn-helix domain-containing protein [Gloeotrichia echinulata DEX184]